MTDLAERATIEPDVLPRKARRIKEWGLLVSVLVGLVVGVVGLWPDPEPLPEVSVTIEEVTPQQSESYPVTDAAVVVFVKNEGEVDLRAPEDSGEYSDTPVLKLSANKGVAVACEGEGGPIRPKSTSREYVCPLTVTSPGQVQLSANLDVAGTGGQAEATVTFSLIEPEPIPSPPSIDCSFSKVGNFASSAEFADRWNELLGVDGSICPDMPTLSESFSLAASNDLVGFGPTQTSAYELIEVKEILTEVFLVLGIEDTSTPGTQAFREFADEVFGEGSVIWADTCTDEEIWHGRIDEEASGGSTVRIKRCLG